MDPNQLTHLEPTHRRLSARTSTGFASEPVGEPTARNPLDEVAIETTLGFNSRTFERCKVGHDAKTLSQIIDDNETLSRSNSKNIDLGSRDFVSSELLPKML